MIDAIFAWCVQLLVFLANLLGISYEAINVWAFVILWPLVTLALIVLLIVQRQQIRRLRREIESARTAQT